MRQSKFTETQIVSILKEADAGRPVNELWRHYGISSATYYKWKAKYGGLEASDVKRLKELEHENGCLKRLYADLSIENAALKEVIAKRLWRVYCQMRLNLPRRTKKRLPVRLRQPLTVIPQPNAVWAVGFMSDTLYGGRRFWTLSILDEGVREGLAFETDTSLPAERVIRVLEQVVSWRGQPQVLRLDNGPELIADRFMTWCAARGIELRHIQPGKPDQNAFIERFNRTYRTEVLNAYVVELLDQKVCQP
jgi:putative transposase